ncbi:MAG: MBL fold metallo-hydrolase [Geitlerinemataceae cyanobacterium]
MTLLHRCSAFVLGLGITVLAPLHPLRAQDLENVEIETVPVAEGIYMLVGEGGNIGVSVGADGGFLIDDQFAPLTEKIQAAVSALGDAPIRFILNTHWHFDHTGGNENFGRAGVAIVAHDNVRERMSVEQFISAFDRTFPASPPEALPIVTFNDTVTFHLNGNTIHTLHVPPAHTDGDSIVHFLEADVIHTGDVYFNGFYPFIDIEHGGSISGMISAADLVLEMADDTTQIIPGHGALSNRTELLAYREMLVVVRDRTQAAIVAGMSADDFIASNPTADLDAIWGNGFLKPEQFLRIVYGDLVRGNG